MRGGATFGKTLDRRPKTRQPPRGSIRTIEITRGFSSACKLFQIYFWPKCAKSMVWTAKNLENRNFVIFLSTGRRQTRPSSLASASPRRDACVQASHSRVPPEAETPAMMRRKNRDVQKIFLKNRNTDCPCERAGRTGTTMWAIRASGREWRDGQEGETRARHRNAVMP
jgi:hypothetical protein